MALASLGEAGALGKFSTSQERSYEGRNLARVCRSIGVQHHHKITGEDGETTSQRIPFAVAGLLDDFYVRPNPQSDLDSVICGMAIYEDHFVQAPWKGAENVWEIMGLITGRDYNRDPFCRLFLGYRRFTHHDPLPWIAQDQAGGPLSRCLAPPAPLCVTSFMSSLFVTMHGQAATAVPTNDIEAGRHALWGTFWKERRSWRVTSQF
jgi:hypothetical protein